MLSEAARQRVKEEIDSFRAYAKYDKEAGLTHSRAEAFEFIADVGQSFSRKFY